MAKLSLSVDELVEAFGCELGFARITKATGKSPDDRNLFVRFGKPETPERESSEEIFLCNVLLAKKPPCFLYAAMGVIIDDLDWEKFRQPILEKINDLNFQRAVISTLSVRNRHGGTELIVSNGLPLHDEALSKAKKEFLGSILQFTLISLFTRMNHVSDLLLKEFGPVH